MTRRFTVDGSDSLEQRIEHDLARIREVALSATDPSEVTALVLGGGYGRGEGGVWREKGEDRIYNDYDLFVVTPCRSRRGRRDLQRRLMAACHPLSREMGADVDFGTPLCTEDLPNTRYELMTMELQHGHRVFHGPEDVLSTMPWFDPALVPLHEGARLLMNRGIGLLLSRQKVRRDGAASLEDRRFVVRNIHKAVMAMGDVVLMAHGCYTPSYRERPDRLAALPPDGRVGVPELPAVYRHAIEFKLHPKHDGPEAGLLTQWLDRTIERYGRVHRWFERCRLDMPAMTWEDYIGLPSRLPRSSLAEKCVNPLRHVRGEGVAAVGRGIRAFLHPRDVLMADLVRVLYLGGSEEAERPLLTLWSRFN